MSRLTTPESRFDDVPGYDYDHAFVTVHDDMRMAYVDEGDGEETFLCLHGEPTWGYLYRHMIPTLAERGRVVVPDFLGFGRSDKYSEVDEYTYDLHYDSLVAFIEALDLTDVTLVCQDWGGILGLAVAGIHPARFARIVAMNTFLPDGTQEMGEAWHTFRDFVERTPDLPVSMLVDRATARDLSDAELAAYDAPFPDVESKAGARAWPDLIPQSPDEPGAEHARRAWPTLKTWEKPAYVLFADSDPITSPARDPLRDAIPTASEQPDEWVEGAMHFLQEDAGADIAERIVAFCDRT